MVAVIREEVQSSSADRSYVVTYDPDKADSWQCSCIGWTRHYPRKDCKHIRYVKENQEYGNASSKVAVKTRTRRSSW